MIPRRQLLTAAAGLLAASGARGQTRGARARSGYAPVNGLKMYYEIHGQGEPLILIHSGAGSSDMFGGIMPALARVRQVIAVDLQGHGRTADIDRPITYEAMAGDIRGLIAHLDLGQADVMGYSLGGGVAFRTAADHPEAVKKLVLVSIALRRDGWYPEILAGMAQMSAQSAEAMKATPMYAAYARLAPRPGDWPVLLDKLGELLRKNYDWSKEAAGIEAPTLLVCGDADAVRTAHAVECFEWMGGGRKDGGWDGSGMSKARLAILPGTTHYNIFSSPALAGAVTAFLDSAQRGA